MFYRILLQLYPVTEGMKPPLMLRMQQVQHLQVVILVLLLIAAGQLIIEIIQL